MTMASVRAQTLMLFAGGGTEVNPGESGETEGGESESEEREGFHFPELL